MKKKPEEPFWDHVVELRNRMLWAASAVLIFSIAGYIVYPYFVQIISGVLGEKLYVNTIVEGFFTRMNVSFVAGFICALPVFILQLCLFIFPGLTAREKNIILGSIITAFALFAFGIIFSIHSVLPASLRFFKNEGFFPGSISLMINYSKFIEFIFKFLLACGLCFEFPVVMIVLLQFRIITITLLVKNLKYVIIVIFVIAAVLAPDVVSQIILALPMIVLYLLTLLAASVFRIGAHDA
ncbi:MAG: twin-arginine translocase subunit TatC [Brevinematales bacterium]|jgi:sec-independent protein translocase protein TatC